jgi:hypothetical protein
MTNHDDGLGFFRGLMYALPLGLLFWALIFLAVRWWMK